MIQQPELADPSEAFRAPADPEEATPDESSSEDTSDESDSSESVQGDAHDVVAAPRSWDPDTIMYRNKKSKIVHVVAIGP